MDRGCRSKSALQYSINVRDTGIRIVIHLFKLKDVLLEETAAARLKMARAHLFCNYHFPTTAFTSLTFQSERREQGESPNENNDK